MQPNSGFHRERRPTYLRKLLRKTGRTQGEVAILLDISQRALEEYLAGRLKVPYLVQYGLERLSEMTQQELDDARAEDEAFAEIERREEERKRQATSNVGKAA